MKTTSKKLWFSLTVTRADGVGVLPILSPRLLPRPRVRPAAPEVSLIGIGVRFLPAPGRRREHDEEHAHVDLPEPVPLLEAARREDDLRGRRAVKRRDRRHRREAEGMGTPRATGVTKTHNEKRLSVMPLGE